MTLLNLAGKKQEHGKLTAIERLHSAPRLGAIWRCMCECGEYRDVPAKRFTIKRRGIKSCVKCTDPAKRELQKKLVRYLGHEWGIEGFESKWIQYITHFDRLQLLTFESLANGRYRDQVLMEAVDMVLRGDSRTELKGLEKPRIERAVKRIQRVYNQRKRRHK